MVAPAEQEDQPKGRAPAVTVELADSEEREVQVGPPALATLARVEAVAGERLVVEVV